MTGMIDFSVVSGRVASEERRMAGRCWLRALERSGYRGGALFVGWAGAGDPWFVYP